MTSHVSDIFRLGGSYLLTAASRQTRIGMSPFVRSSLASTCSVSLVGDQYISRRLSGTSLLFSRIFSGMRSTSETVHRSLVQLRQNESVAKLSCRHIVYGNVQDLAIRSRERRLGWSFRRLLEMLEWVCSWGLAWCGTTSTHPRKPLLVTKCLEGVPHTS